MFKRVQLKVVGFLRQGITPRQLALTFAFGACIGIIPLLGTTMLLCAGVALWFRLNPAVIQVVNYLVYPLQLLLFIPFLKAGAELFGMAAFQASLGQILAGFKAQPWTTIVEFFRVNMAGLAVWTLISPVLFLVIFLALKPLFTRMERTMTKSA